MLTPNNSGALIASTCGSSPRPTKLQTISPILLSIINGTHIVETPASIADESVSAEELVKSYVFGKVDRYSQHWTPIKKENSNIGAVYCPSVL